MKSSTNYYSLSGIAKVFKYASICANSNPNSISEFVRNSNVLHVVLIFRSNAQVLLFTAIVVVKNSAGGVQLSRAVLYLGSQTCLITKGCFGKLDIPKKEQVCEFFVQVSKDTCTKSSQKLVFFPKVITN